MITEKREAIFNKKRYSLYLLYNSILVYAHGTRLIAFKLDLSYSSNMLLSIYKLKISTKIAYLALGWHN